MRGVILYGPPAAGKDTITRTLTETDPAFRLFRRLKAGPGRTAGYRMATVDRLQHLRSRGDVVWENDRYGARYVVDRPALRNDLTDHVPVVHLGQAEAVEAVRSAIEGARWLTVYVWCPRPLAQHRIEARATGDTSDRLRAWDETPPLPGADLSINTAEVSPAEAARLIRERLERVAA
ncbi:kinase [Micromonospora tulbaghiae]|uniref:kinase n=1 Tax=Micromonospora tulbaghiae TaxID=479978 RepID=UPI003EBDC3B3